MYLAIIRLLPPAFLLLLLLPLAILQHRLVNPPELDICPALLMPDPFLLLVATSITIAKSTTVVLLRMRIVLSKHYLQLG